MVATDDNPQDARLWQGKYYDSLEAFEKKEKQWAEVEDLLRRTLSRLTLAAEGSDDALDRQLKELRDAIRDREDSRRLGQRIEAMTRTLVKLDEARNRQARATRAPHPLLQLLERLPLPKGTGRRVKQLRKELEGLADETTPDTLIQGFAELVREALDLAREEAPATATPGNTPAREGLLQRLFGKGERTADTSPAAELERLSEELPGKLPKAEADSAPAAPDSVTPATRTPEPTGLRTEEALLQLLEQLELPAEYSARVEVLQDRLEQGVQERDWPALLGEIAGLVREIRQRIQTEKKELETFLRQLTERLQEVDAQLQGSESLREARLQSSRELDAAVKQEVRGMESRVQAAEDLDQLKSELQTHLDNIVQQLGQHQREEEQSHQQAREEMSRLQSRLQTMEEEAERLRNRARDEHHQAMTDSLTGIPNRLAFDEHMAGEFARWKRFHTPLALLVWDVDRFKDLNDQYGHKAGDKVLKAVAQTLQEHIRETDFIARYGGEEFVLIMSGAEVDVLEEVANKLRSAVSGCGFHFRGNAVQVTISCGIASFAGEDTPETVFERADRALYRAKDLGRDRCEFAAT
ncbi:MAG TPA: diguanylate cyclase [Gammaproteobacteria bacterium]